MTDPTTDPTAPSRRAGLRDEIVAAVVRLHESGGLYALDAGEDGRIADAVLPVLYREWPWLRAEADDAAPADQTALRDRIADALHPLLMDTLPKVIAAARAREAADAVLAVLPATTNQTADWDALVCEADRLRRDGAALHAKATEIDAQLAALRKQVTEPVDRAAVLREAADDLDNSERLRDLTDDHMLDINAAANELRRMADESPAAETGPLCCPLCADKPLLRTPVEAHDHFRTVHPERQLAGPGPWPLLVPPSCPGFETLPNRCACPCEGCKHHCGAHQPAAGARQDGAQ